MFICYKETDENGKRTVDSALANDIYYQLTQEGLKVFYAAITLEDKLGREYEPYIFAALHSAKVMLVVGTKPEYFEAVWVRNEWSRFLKLMNTDRTKLLIPCYRDMDAYDLPEEFAHLQAQDMSKIGFVNDVVRGIKKVIGDGDNGTAKETVIVASESAASVAPLLKRVFIFLEDGEWAEADEYCEKVLDQDPECGEAYLGKLMAELKVRTKDDLKDVAEPFENLKNAIKACKYDLAIAEQIKDANIFIHNRNETDRKQGIYDNAQVKMLNAVWEYEFYSASDLFKSISGFKDAAEKAHEEAELAQKEAELTQKEQLYNNVVSSMNSAKSEKDFKECAYLFDRISGFKDSDELLRQCLEQAEIARKYAIEKAEVERKDTIYDGAVLKISNQLIKSNEEAIKLFESIIDWRDSRTKIDECNAKIDEIRIAEEKAEAERKRKAEEARIAAEKAKARNKKIAMIGTIAALLLVLIVMFLLVFFFPANNYTKALAAVDAENYEEAYSLFDKKPYYKDTKDQIAAAKLKEATALLDAKKYDEAYIILEAIGNKDAVTDSMYARAMEYLEAKDYDSAYALLNQLGDTEKINESMYNRAVEFINAGDNKAAYEILYQISEYKDSKSKISSLIKENPKLKYKMSNVGDIVTFGKYYQSDSKTKEDIEWRVLAKEGNKILVISEYALDCQQYNKERTSVTWEKCTLRKWLNDTFFKAAFGNAEQSMIKSTKVTADKNPSYSTDPGNDTSDKIFLLSITEVKEYFSSSEDRVCKPTTYAEDNGAWTNSSSGVCWWFLRSPGYDSGCVATVVSDGDISDNGTNVYDNTGCVRPVLWIEIG